MLESEEWQTVSYVVDTQVAAAVAPATIIAGQPQSSYNISSLLLLSFYRQKKLFTCISMVTRKRCVFVEWSDIVSRAINVE